MTEMGYVSHCILLNEHFTDRTEFFIFRYAQGSSELFWYHKRMFDYDLKLYAARNTAKWM